VGGGQREGLQGYWCLRGVMEIVVLCDGWGFVEVCFLCGGMVGVVVDNLVSNFVATCDDV